MKPIEIHIEGYKIVISEDDKDITYKQEKDDDNTITLPNYPHTIPCPYTPPTIQPQDDWWKYPIVTWSTNTDATSININEKSHENEIIK